MIIPILEDLLIPLNQDEKTWIAKAMGGLIVSDGYISEEELRILRESIKFLGNIELIEQIVAEIKNKKVSQIGALKVDRTKSVKMLFFLARVALADNKLTLAGAKHFGVAAQKLGFSKNFAKRVIAWAREVYQVEKKGEGLMNEGQKTKALFVDVD